MPFFYPFFDSIETFYNIFNFFSYFFNNSLKINFNSFVTRYVAFGDYPFFMTVGAVALTTVLQLAVIYVPFLQSVFKTMALPPLELVICLVASTALFWAVEINKWFKRRNAGG